MSVGFLNQNKCVWIRACLEWAWPGLPQWWLSADWWTWRWGGGGGGGGGVDVWPQEYKGAREISLLDFTMDASLYAQILNETMGHILTPACWRCLFQTNSVFMSVKILTQFRVSYLYIDNGVCLCFLKTFHHLLQKASVLTDFQVFYFRLMKPTSLCLFQRHACLI